MSYFPTTTIQDSGTLNGTYVSTPTLGATVDNGHLNVTAILHDGPNLDAFSRLRVSNPGFRFDGQFIYQSNTEIWDSVATNGTVTWDSTNRMTVLSNGSGAGSAVVQSHYNAPYTPGRSQLTFVTFCLQAAPTTGQTKRVGYFDGTNGVYLEWSAATGVSVNIASGTTNGNQQVVQANWNIDRMDGTGPSGLTLDLTKTQIFVVQLQALYVGRVVVLFDINGQLWPVHQFTHANAIAYPYMQQASLPVRYEVINASAAAASSMAAVCASVISEGGVDLLEIPGRPFAASTGLAAVTVSTRRPVLTIRPKATFNGVRNSSIVIPQDSGVTAATNTAYIELVRSGTVTGPANTPFTDVDATNSVVEVNTNGTDITGGQTLLSFYVPASGATRTAISASALGRLLLAYSHVLPQNPADTFSVVVTSTTGNTSVQATLAWKEVR